MLYAVQPEQGGPIKIGYTAGEMQDRLAALQCGSPVRLVVARTWSGSQRDEARLHRSLAAHRLHGEWFDPCPEVMAAIGLAVVATREPPPLLGPRFIDRIWHGPLTARQAAVIEAADAEWRSSREIAALVGQTAAEVAKCLVTLRGRGWPIASMRGGEDFVIHWSLLRPLWPAVHPGGGR